MIECVGVDGAKAGWIAVMLRDGRFAGASVMSSFFDVLEAYGSQTIIGVDMPIGLPERDGHRLADLEAKRFIGGLRSSVFLVPPRPVLEASSYEEARRVCLELTGRSISAQSYALRHRVLEVDGLVEERVYEVHPEVSFAALQGSPLTTSKRSWAGALQRRDLLRATGIEIPTDIGPAGAAPMDDVLDAAVAAWTADRIARSAAQTLPRVPPKLANGRPIAIWY